MGSLEGVTVSSSIRGKRNINMIDIICLQLQRSVSWLENQFMHIDIGILNYSTLRISLILGYFTSGLAHLIARREKVGRVVTLRVL